jgi:tetratricopeptide (TPR) repeat protein
MANKKIKRKELLKSPDELVTLTGRVVNLFRSHEREAVYAGIAVCLAVVLYLGGIWYVSHINRMGQQAYNKAYYMLAEGLDNDAAVSDDTLQKAYNLFEAVIKNYGLSKTGKLALPEAGYVAFQLKQYDNSIRCYKEFVDRATSDMKKSGLSSLSLLSVSSCYEAKGEFGKAADTLKPLVELLGTPFRDLAMLDLERVYRLNKQPLQAKRVLEQFVLDYKSSPFFPEAKSRLLEYD